MWVSSFAREGDLHARTAATSSAAETAFRVRAHVWGSGRAATPAQLQASKQSRVALSTDDALTLAMTADINVLRRLKIVNGSYVRVSAIGESAHVAKLVLVGAGDALSSSPSPTTDGSGENEEASGEHEVIGDITLSPLLAFNLGISLHATTTAHVTAMVRFHSYVVAIDGECGVDALQTDSSYVLLRIGVYSSCAAARTGA